MPESGTSSPQSIVKSLLYYLFSAHHWPLSELQRLWEGETKWWDLLVAMSSFEAGQRKKGRGVRHLDKKNVKLTRVG